MQLEKALPVWRTLLYVPANVEKFVAKAHTRGADVIPPVYAVSVADLRQTLRRIIAQEARSERVADDAAARMERYVIRTNLMRFPDTIRVQFIDLGNNTATLAIYAQAQIGYSDRGVHKTRLQRWLQALDMLPKASCRVRQSKLTSIHVEAMYGSTGAKTAFHGQ